MKYEYEYGDGTYKAFQAINRVERKLQRQLSEKEIGDVCLQMGADAGKVKRNLDTYFISRTNLTLNSHRRK